MIILVIVVLILLIILLFTSRKLSPIPYFPSNKQDLPLIVKALNLRNGQTVVDLGAGDGIVIFAAASRSHERKLNTKFIAVEINPVLIFILHLRRLLHPNRENIRIILADMFKLNVSTLAKKDITVFLYISPWFMEKIYRKLKRDLRNYRLVSYFYKVPEVKVKKTLSGRNELFTY